jgi:hypothetical protein
VWPREAIATALRPNASTIAAGARIGASGAALSASETHAAWPATSPPLGPVIADVTPPVRATGIATERAS